MKNCTFISFFFLLATLNVSGQQKMSSLKSGADDGTVLNLGDTIPNVVVPVSLSAGKMPLGGEVTNSPLKTQAPQPKDPGVKNTEPAKASDKITSPKGNK